MLCYNKPRKKKKKAQFFDKRWKKKKKKIENWKLSEPLRLSAIISFHLFLYMAIFTQLRHFFNSYLSPLCMWLVCRIFCSFQWKEFLLLLQKLSALFKRQNYVIGLRVNAQFLTIKKHLQQQQQQNCLFTPS